MLAFKPAFLHLLDKDEDEDIVDDEVDALKPAFLHLLMMRILVFRMKFFIMKDFDDNENIRRR